MNFREITVGGLIDFIHSEEYSKLEPKPITSLRAVSQYNNPAAHENDIALVFASENNILLAFAGLLPDNIIGSSEPVFSNTGWWVHPELGRRYGLPVFLKAYTSCHRRMFFTDCSEYTKTILEKTGLFLFQPPLAGSRFFLRFYSGNLFRRKGKGRVITALFSIADAFLNSLFFPWIAYWRKKNLPHGYSVQNVEKINEELDAFIKKHSGKNYLKQYGDKLNWIIQNPWVTDKNNVLPVSYPFSHITNSFRQEFLEVKKNEETVALMCLSIRDNQVSVPYIYCDEKYLIDTIKLLWNHLILSGVESMTIFQADVVKAIRKAKVLFIFKLKIFRFCGYSKELSQVFSGDKKFQDGEGDVAFT